MKQWFINLARRLDNWEASFGKNVDRFELRQVNVHYEELADEVAILDDTQGRRLEAYDREAALKRDNFVAGLQIERIKKKHELAALTHRKAVLESALGIPKEGV